MSWGDLFSAAGSIVGAYTSYKQSEDAEDRADRQAAEVQRASKANAELSIYDAEVMELAANEEIRSYNDDLIQFNRELNELLATQKTRIAKSGFVTTSGTPLSVMEQTLKTGRKEYAKIKYEGEKRVDYRKSEAKRYRMLADKGLREGSAQASLIREEGQNRSDYYMYAGISQGLTDIYDLGSNAGWW